VKRTHLVVYLCLPALVALASLFLQLRREPLTAELLTATLVWGFLFYATPFILWAGVSAAVKPVLWAWHGGFVVSSCALAFVCALSIHGPHDPSGLPYEWLIYWPVAGIALAIVLLVWWFNGHRHAGA
jgi:hypothetical protein